MPQVVLWRLLPYYFVLMGIMDCGQLIVEMLDISLERFIQPLLDAGHMT